MAKKTKSKKKKGGFLLGALIGLGAGAASVFLSNKDNREKVGRAADKAKTEAKKYSDRVNAEGKKLQKRLKSNKAADEKGATRVADAAKKEAKASTARAKKTVAAAKKSAKRVIKK
jgi:hypothetical protein